METNVHLFEDCKRTSAVWQAMHQWHKYQCIILQFKKEIMAAICGAIIYHTWRARNWRRFRDICVHMEEAVTQIKKEISEITPT
ncbi:hypothetical protein H5410_024248 [Solanum commersonii]|uniref:Uncharacterized protein n=1 Tax=Solanum commersonii TaxID=4109 RepID=A0A9J5ZLG1_SOLCO|nr:hypothetical protein H5410_024248 [Solanum commersonii]